MTTHFRSPQRRTVTRTSGFEVCEETTGGECIISESSALLDIGKKKNFSFKKEELRPPEIWNNEECIIAFAGYIKSSEHINLEINIFGEIQGREVSKNKNYDINSDEWQNIGIHIEEDIDVDEEVIAEIEVELNVESTNNIEKFEFYGINLDTITWDDYLDNYYYGEQDEDIRKAFHQKTKITVPYLYYLDHNEPLHIYPYNIQKEEFKNGSTVVLKSCNRCGRYLLVEYEKEKQRNLISFGNHCVKRAPCDHSSFGFLKVIQSKPDEISAKLKDIIIKDEGDYFVDLHYGYQLECKACKKFYVNFPLNPQRTSSQHREDSLRRRSLEVLIRKLTDEDWVYHEFRLEKKKEFDKHIWEKFDKKCFNCDRKLPAPENMDLDHTLPLSALYPLDDTATCLCPECNSRKSDKFPAEFYTKEKLKKLSSITELDYEKLTSKEVNENVIEELEENIVWFFDDFLMNDEYQKTRDRKRTSDLIVKAIQKQLSKSDVNLDLIELYKEKKGMYPKSVTIDS